MGRNCTASAGLAAEPSARVIDSSAVPLIVPAVAAAMNPPLTSGVPYGAQVPGVAHDCAFLTPNTAVTYRNPAMSTACVDSGVRSRPPAIVAGEEIAFSPVAARPASTHTASELARFVPIPDTCTSSTAPAVMPGPSPPAAGSPAAPGSPPDAPPQPASVPTARPASSDTMPARTGRPREGDAPAIDRRLASGVRSLIVQFLFVGADAGPVPGRSGRQADRIVTQPGRPRNTAVRRAAATGARHRGRRDAAWRTLATAGAVRTFPRKRLSRPTPGHGAGTVRAGRGTGAPIDARARPRTASRPRGLTGRRAPAPARLGACRATDPVTISTSRPVIASPCSGTNGGSSSAACTSTADRKYGAPVEQPAAARLLGGQRARARRRGSGRRGGGSATGGARVRLIRARRRSEETDSTAFGQPA